MRFRPGLLAVLLLAGCGDPLSPGDLSVWADARARWERRSPANYEIEISISCFCATEVHLWTRVRVVGGVVTHAQAVDSATPYPAELLTYWPTVEELFARVLQAGQSDGVARIEARYDPTHGFPTVLDISYDSSIQDAGAVYRLRNYRPWDPVGPQAPRRETGRFDPGLRR